MIVRVLPALAMVRWGGEGGEEGKGMGWRVGGGERIKGEEGKGVKDEW